MHDYTPDPSTFHELIPLIDDSDTPDAANFEVSNEALGDNCAHARLVAVSNACTNFLAPITTLVDPGSVAATLVAACWQPVVQSWYALFAEGPPGSGTPFYTYETHTSGVVWRNISSSGGTTKGILAAAASSADTGAVFVSLHNASTGTDIVRTGPTGAPVTTAQGFLGTLVTATIVYTPSGYLLFGTEQSGGTFTGHAASSTDGTGVWTDLSTSLPSGWGTGAHSIEAAFSATNGAALTSPRAVLVAFSTLSSTFSQLLANDGAGGFVDVTPAFVGAGLGSIFGITWNPGLKLWGISVVPPGSVGGTFYTSADGLTWTLRHTFAVGTDATSIAAVGFTWFVGTARMLCSPDNGATWTTVSCAAGASNLESSGNQLLAWNTTNHAFSLQAGFMSGGQY